MVPNIPPQEASNRLQIFQVKLHFLYVNHVLLFFKVILGKNLCVLPYTGKFSV